MNKQKERISQNQDLKHYNQYYRSGMTVKEKKSIERRIAEDKRQQNLAARKYYE